MTNQEKEDIEKKILEEISNALEKGELKADDSAAIANFILEKLDGVSSSTELVNFLQELSQKWPVFNNLLEIEKGKQEQKDDQVAVGQVEDLARKGKIDEALSVAKSAIEE